MSNVIQGETAWLFDQTTGRAVGVVDFNGREQKLSPRMPTPVTVSRYFASADDGDKLQPADGITLTLRKGDVLAGFECVIVLPTGTVYIAAEGGVLLNGLTATVGRIAASNPVFSIIATATADSYIVTGF